MIRILATVVLTSISTLAFSACGSSGDAGSQSDELDPMAYCSVVSPLWDYQAIPNYDDEMSGAERATTITKLKAAISSLPQGVVLGALTEEQADLMAKVISTILPVYEDPLLDMEDAAAMAEANGLSAEEFAAIEASARSDLAESAVKSLDEYCKPS